MVDFGARRRDRPAHLAHLADVDDDGGNAHDVVIVGQQFGFEGLARGKIQDRGGRGDVLLDHQDAPGAVKHAEGERPLLTGHLVVIQLHGVDLAAAELVVLRVGTENGTEEDAGANALWMLLHFKTLGADYRVLKTLSLYHLDAGGVGGVCGKIQKDTLRARDVGGRDGPGAGAVGARLAGNPGTLRAAGLSDLSPCVSAAQWIGRLL